MFQRREFEISGDFSERDLRERPETIARSISDMESLPEVRAVWMVAIRAK